MAVYRQAQGLSKSGAAKALELQVLQLNKRWNHIESIFAQYRRSNYTPIVSFPKQALMLCLHCLLKWAMHKESILKIGFVVFAWKQMQPLDILSGAPALQKCPT